MAQWTILSFFYFSISVIVVLSVWMAHVFWEINNYRHVCTLYHWGNLLIVEWILRHSLSFLFHQELPARLLLTYKPEEAEEAPELVPIVEEKPQVVEESAPVPSTSEIASPPPKPEVADTGDLLVSIQKISESEYDINDFLIKMPYFP